VPWSQNATENRYVFKCLLKVVSDGQTLVHVVNDTFDGGTLPQQSAVTCLCAGSAGFVHC